MLFIETQCIIQLVDWTGVVALKV